MYFKKGQEVVCIVGTNSSLTENKIYLIRQISEGGFISLSGIYDNNRNYKFFNPKHFKSLNCVRKHKINRLI